MAQWTAVTSPGWVPSHLGCFGAAWEDGGSGLSSASRRIQGKPELSETVLRIKLSEDEKNRSAFNETHAQIARTPPTRAAAQTLPASLSAVRVPSWKPAPGKGVLQASPAPVPAFLTCS